MLKLKFAWLQQPYSKIHMSTKLFLTNENETPQQKDIIMYSSINFRMENMYSRQLIQECTVDVLFPIFITR